MLPYLRTKMAVRGMMESYEDLQQDDTAYPQWAEVLGIKRNKSDEVSQMPGARYRNRNQHKGARYAKLAASLLFLSRMSMELARGPKRTKSNQQRTISDQKPTINNHQSTNNYQQSTNNNQLSAISDQQPTNNNQRSAINNKSTINHQRRLINNQRLTNSLRSTPP